MRLSSAAVALRLGGGRWARRKAHGQLAVRSGAARWKGSGIAPAPCSGMWSQLWLQFWRCKPLTWHHFGATMGPWTYVPT